MYLKNILGQIEADGLYCHWVAPFLAVFDNCTLAHSMPVEQEPPTSSGKGRERLDVLNLSVGCKAIIAIILSQVRTKARLFGTAPSLLAEAGNSMLVH